MRAQSAGAVAGAPAPGPKVAYVMSRFPKLTETFVLNEIRALEALGASVEVYPLLRARQRVIHPEAEGWAQRARFLPFLSWGIARANVRAFIRGPGAYLRLVRDVVGGVWGSANFFVGALGIFPKCVAFAGEMQARGVQHVHAHFATHPALAAFIVHRLTGIPYSFTAHGSDLHVDRRMLDAKVEAAAFAVTVSDFNREVMVRECGEEARAKIHVVHCGVDPAFFLPRAPALPDGRAVRVICVASFEPVKGHRFLLEACRTLRDRGVDFRCDLVGEGPLRGVLQREVVRLGLERRVRFRGALARGEVASQLRRADIAVLASCPTREGKREEIPVALMEAMATGLPVVASAISGIPELVENGEEGVLVPPGNAGALADALQRLAADPGLRERLGGGARRKILREFTVDSGARRLLSLVEAGAGVERGNGREPWQAERQTARA